MNCMTGNSIQDTHLANLGALTAKQIMTRLNISKSSLARLVETKKLVPLNAFRRNRLFSIESILTFLNDKKK